MTSQQFNDKYFDQLEPGFYGLAIEDTTVINYLDGEFTKELAVNPDFTYSQIKLKWGNCRIYAESEKVPMWEQHIDNIIRNN